MKSHSAVCLILVLVVLILAGCQPAEPEAVSEQAEPVGTNVPAAAEEAISDTAEETNTESPAQPVRVESDGEVPFYARLGENETFGDGTWTVIVFYRPPECIPPDFNLNQFFHFPDENGPGAFGCGPTTTTGVEMWQNGPETDPAPLQAETTGRGEVPVWFVSDTDMQAAMEDGILTIGDLAAMQTLLTGTAATYSELLRPSQSNAEPLVQFTAEGSLDSGAPFAVDVSKGAEDVDDHVTIDIQASQMESGGEVPFYARFGENETFSNGEWAVIVFYRPPDCIPADFNLNEFFHFPSDTGPGAFGCGPTTTNGIELWKNGPETDPAPLEARTIGRGTVPIWFIADADMRAALEDGIVTIGELAELPSRLVGTAANYSEFLRPGQTNATPLVQFVAEGILENGNSFTVDVSSGASNVADHVTIDLDE